MKLLKKNLLFKVLSSDDEKYIIRGVFSTGQEDRADEVVDQSGWKLEEYMENPVVLFAHDHYQPAIAKCIELGKDDQGNLTGALQFAAEEYEFAKTIYLLYKNEYMRAFSVGFMNNLYEVDQENDRIILRENTLYEISCVNVPCNALALAYSKGIEGVAKFEKELLGQKKIEKKDDEIDVNKLNKQTIQSVIKVLTDALKTDEADNQEVKGRNPEKSGGQKKVSVKMLNSAIRQLIKTKKQITKK